MTFEDRILENPRLLKLKNTVTNEVINFEVQDYEPSEIVQEGTEVNAQVMNTLVQNPVVSDAYDPTKTYTAGEYCIQNNTLYRANANTTGTWDSTKWDATSIAAELANRLEFEIVDSW